MPIVVVSRADDEIADLIDRVRTAGDPDIGLVVPPGSRALQTPLNARLLSQYCRNNSVRVAIISEDQRIQQVAATIGFTAYATQLAYERGIELLPPRAPAGVPTELGAATTAVAVEAAPPRVTSATAAAPTGAPPQPPRPEPRRVLQVPAPAPRSVGRDRRRVLYFAGAAVAIVGLILFFTLSPSATVSITVAATPLSVSQTIQGSTDPSQASQSDHILTAVVTSSGNKQFEANPTGHATLPATSAKGSEVITLNAPPGSTGYFVLHTGDFFQANDPTASGQFLTFVVTQDTHICVGGGPAGTPPPGGMCTDSNEGFKQYPANDAAPIQAQTAGAKWNVAAGAITTWTQNPQPNFYSASNPSATSGGADPKQVVVASAQDVSSWNTQVQSIESDLTQQVNADMTSKANGKTFAVDPGGNGKTIAFTVKPAIPAAGAQFSKAQVTISVDAKAAVYDMGAVRKDITADLQAQVPQAQQLAPGKLNMQQPAVTEAADDGTVILSVNATSYSQPIVDLEGLKSQLAGKNPGDAQRIIENHIDHVQTVTVSEFPFKLFYLPFFSSRIEIDENFVAQQAPAS